MKIYMKIYMKIFLILYTYCKATSNGKADLFTKQFAWNPVNHPYKRPEITFNDKQVRLFYRKNVMDHKIVHNMCLISIITLILIIKIALKIINTWITWINFKTVVWEECVIGYLCNIFSHTHANDRGNSNLIPCR